MEPFLTPIEGTETLKRIWRGLALSFGSTRPTMALTESVPKSKLITNFLEDRNID